MTRTKPPAFDLDKTYVQLEDGPGAVPVEVDADFWAQIGERTHLHEGRLVTLTHSTSDWPVWEMHPAGDEIVYLLTGAVDLVLEEDQGQRTVRLRGRACCIVPKDVWHRAIVHEPSDVLHITRGKDTQHRPV